MNLGKVKGHKKGNQALYASVFTVLQLCSN